MPPTGRMRHLTTVQGSFHGRVVAARLGAEGILVELRGVSEGPYPLQGSVEVLVSVDQLDLAREILLADAVDAAVDADAVELDYPQMIGGLTPGPVVAQEDAPRVDAPRPPRMDRIGAVVALVLVVALVVVAIFAVSS